MPRHLPSIDTRGFGFKGRRSIDDQKGAANYQNYHLLPGHGGGEGAVHSLRMGAASLTSLLAWNGPFLLSVSLDSSNSGWISFVFFFFFLFPSNRRAIAIRTGFGCSASSPAITNKSSNVSSSSGFMVTVKSFRGN